MEGKGLPVCAVWTFQDLLRNLLSASNRECADIAYRGVEAYITLLYGSFAIGDAQQEAMRTLLAVAWDSVIVRLAGAKDSHLVFHY